MLNTLNKHSFLLIDLGKSTLFTFAPVSDIVSVLINKGNTVSEREFSFLRIVTGSTQGCAALWFEGSAWSQQVTTCVYQPKLVKIVLLIADCKPFLSLTPPASQRKLKGWRSALMDWLDRWIWQRPMQVLLIVSFTMGSGGFIRGFT